MRNQQLISSIATVCTLALAGSGMAQREPRDLIEWPKERGDFPTLQSAIDALRDNGKLSIQAGRYDLTQSLVVRGKRVTIEGAGCVDSRGNSRNTKETHLAGPPTVRVAPFLESAGLITYVADAGAVTGGTVGGLRISGSDAGIRLMAGEGVEAGRSVLTIEDTCIEHTGRGIASSAPAAKIMASNLLIKDVLWNGISISPSVLSGLADSFLQTFGLIVLNTGQACVVVKHGVYNGHQDALHNCGYFGGGLPGLGAGILASSAGVNFSESSIVNPNGPGFAAHASTTFIFDSFISFATGMGILLFEPLYASIKKTHVTATLPFPAGNFGDSLTVAGPGTVWVGDSFFEDSARAGIANFGSFIDVGNTDIECAGFDIEGEPYPTSTDNFLFNDRGGNHCGCPTATGTCLAVSAGLEPPTATVVLE